MLNPIPSFVVSIAVSLQNSLAHFDCRKAYRNYQKSTILNLEKRHNWSDEGFKGIVMNRALPSLHGVWHNYAYSSFNISIKKYLDMLKGMMTIIESQRRRTYLVSQVSVFFSSWAWRRETTNSRSSTSWGKCRTTIL